MSKADIKRLQSLEILLLNIEYESDIFLKIKMGEWGIGMCEELTTEKYESKHMGTWEINVYLCIAH